MVASRQDGLRKLLLKKRVCNSHFRVPTPHLLVRIGGSGVGVWLMVEFRSEYCPDQSPATCLEKKTYSLSTMINFWFNEKRGSNRSADGVCSGSTGISNLSTAESTGQCEKPGRAYREGERSRVSRVTFSFLLVAPGPLGSNGGAYGP